MLGKKCSLAPLKEELRKQGVSMAQSQNKEKPEQTLARDLSLLMLKQPSH